MDEPRTFAPDESVPADAESFQLPSYSGDGRDWVMGQSVFYLPDEHEPHEVIGAFLDANPEFEEEVPDWGIYQRIQRRFPNEWGDAARAMLGPFDSGPNASDSEEHWTKREKECNLCGETFTGGRGAHLINHCEATSY